MRRARAVLGTACGTHFVHDGFADILYVLFPVWAREFGLSFAQVGLLRTAYSGAMATFQIPAGLLAERWGEARLLAAGTAATALGFIAAGFAGGYLALLGCLLAAGLGSGVQHPLSSTLVSNAYDDGGRRTALGTYNFSGDLGKVAVPAAVAFAVPWLGWRGAVESFAAIGLLAAVLVLLALTNLKIGHVPVPMEKSERSSGSDWGIRDLRGFQALSLIQVIDSSTRTGLLTFLPFLLIAKGSSVRAVGFALMLIFAGGAVGKFACGVLAERLGVIRTVIITETATGVGILLLLALPLSPALALLPVLGIALNGTSSVLYGTVADLVDSDRRARSYAIFYTLGIGASALSPSIYGVVSDWGGVPLALAIVGSVVFVTLPLTLALRRPLAAATA
jgi:FSR family fosmidomycin resistance protein-like MFS transporter